jgi:hypothetical protein
MATVKHTLKPEEAQFLAANFPQYVKNNGTNFPVAGLAYDGGSTDEEAFWQFRAVNYGSGQPISVKIVWYADNASSGNVKWGARIAAITPNVDTYNVETKSFATQATVIDTNLGSTQQLHSCEIVIRGGDLDALSPDDEVWIGIARNASDTTNDTMSNDAILVSVEVSYSDI